MIIMLQISAHSNTFRRYRDRVGGESYIGYIKDIYLITNGFSGSVKLKLSANFTLIRFKDIELTRRSTHQTISNQTYLLILMILFLE